MGKITFILGGVRSGKSRYGVTLAKAYKRVAFLATCEALDSEMEKRIARHKNERPKHWVTLEEPCDIALVAKQVVNKCDLVLVDCLTLWVSNCLLKKFSDKKMVKMLENLLKTVKKSHCDVVFVSNEVGLGIVPDNKLARKFRDLAGQINQLVAKASDTVFFMTAGIPVKIK